MSLDPHTPHPTTHLALGGTCVMIFSPVHAIVTVGHLVGSDILHMAKVPGTLSDDARHPLLGTQVDLWGEGALLRMAES